MSKMSDPEYLRTEQYADPTNLNARAALHERFSVNPREWQPWVFDQLDVPAGARVLEVGCGPAGLWAANLGRVPDDWAIVLSDFSPGMVRAARARLGDRFAYANLDVQTIPFAPAHFDAVIANHMLYHVPDIGRAVAEIRRVLRPGGAFYAATNGQAHMGELFELAARFDAKPWERLPDEMFWKENGAELLVQCFDRVVWYPYEDALVVTEIEPLMAYVLSSASSLFDEARRTAFQAHVEGIIARDGAFHIAKDSGLFVAWVLDDISS